MSRFRRCEGLDLAWGDWRLEVGLWIRVIDVFILAHVEASRFVTSGNERILAGALVSCGKLHLLALCDSWVGILQELGEDRALRSLAIWPPLRERSGLLQCQHPMQVNPGGRFAGALSVVLGRSVPGPVGFLGGGGVWRDG